MTPKRHIHASWFAAILLLGLGIPGCTDLEPPAPRSLFTSESPRNASFRQELVYLEQTRKTFKQERQKVEEELTRVQNSLGVPKSLLWCVLFQESRFDTFKNALTHLPAKGIGQFTRSALIEINEDTDLFDSRTSAIIKREVHPRSLPMGFLLNLKPKKGAPPKKGFPEQPVHSYYHTPTAIFASAAYLNNRYYQLKMALDRQNISYNPDVLWLYAAAAYNKGARTVFLLLTHEYLNRGEKVLLDILQNSKAAYQLLTHTEALEYTLKEIWGKKTRARYLDELLRNMEVIASCALEDHSL